MDGITELKKKVASFVRERRWEKFHNPKDISISISLEAAELLENFQWRSNEEIEKMLESKSYFTGIKEEMADIMIYLVAMSNRLGVDLVEEAFKKMEKNERKYPADKFRGTI
ncbi:MAG: nucleotide pyrophosphohydrolase [Thermoplasmata archaeon]|nr:nucleotide pyrophosphohydrolase [Thermoplasmata archaeon]